MLPETPIPSVPAVPDLNDAEFAELDDLLAQTPEPLDGLDAVMLDGFLCAVLVQPAPVAAARPRLAAPAVPAGPMIPRPPRIDHPGSPAPRGRPSTRRDCPTLPASPLKGPRSLQPTPWRGDVGAVFAASSLQLTVLAFLPIPVIVAGEAWIRNKGLTHDASTPAEYFRILDRLPFAERLAICGAK